MKEHVSLTTAAIEMGKRHFLVILTTVAKRKKKMLHWVITFLILKILASNSKQFRFYGIFKKWKIDDRGGREATKYYIFLDKFSLKEPQVSKIPLGMFF